jgi:serine/threonine-protein kinase RsbT
MMVTRDETMPLNNPDDIVRVRQIVRQWAVEIGFSLVDQTKIVTAASELARNTMLYGGGGEARIEELLEGRRIGLKVIFEDRGPGIVDIDKAMVDGFTTGNGLGLGLSGAKRLSNDFEIKSAPGEGTRVAITRWKGQ